MQFKPILRFQFHLHFVYFINCLWQWPVRSGPSRTVCVALRQCGSVKGAWSWTMASGPQFQGPGGSEVRPLLGPDLVLELSRMLGVRAPGPPNSNDTLVCAFDWEFRGRVLGGPLPLSEVRARMLRRIAPKFGNSWGARPRCPRGVSIARSEPAAVEKELSASIGATFEQHDLEGEGTHCLAFAANTRTTSPAF